MAQERHRARKRRHAGSENDDGPTNLMEAAEAMEFPSPQQMPDPLRYYRVAKAALAPDVRSRNDLEAIEGVIDTLSKQNVFPVIPWLFVQLEAIGAWPVKYLYVAAVIQVGAKSWSRWDKRKERDGIQKLWQDAARILPSVSAAEKAITNYLKKFDADRPLPEPDDEWPLRERTWFSRALPVRIACQLALENGIAPQELPPDISIERVARQIKRRSTVEVVRRPNENRPAFLGRIWTPALG